MRYPNHHLMPIDDIPAAELLELLPQAVFIRSLNGDVRDSRFLEVNQAACDLLGYSREQLLEMSPAQLNVDLPPDPSDAAERIRENGHAELRRLLRHAGGAPVLVELSVRIVQHRDNPLVVSLARRVTSEEEDASRLRASEQRYRAVFAAARDALLLADGTSGVLVEVNDAACELMNRSRDDLIGSHQTTLHPSEERDRYAKIFMDYLRHPEGILAGLEIVRPDGERIPVDISAARFTVDGEPFLLGNFRDVRERLEAVKRAEQLRDMGRELIRAEERERRRLAQVLHDNLQQLLVAARIRAETVKLRLGDAKAIDSLEEVVGILQTAIGTARSLSVELTPPILEENGLVPAFAWLATQMRQRYNLDVEVDAESEAEPQNLQLRLFLFQSVRELLFNIVKHARVTSAHLHVNRSSPGELTIEVYDRGAGFAPEAVDEQPQAGTGLSGIRRRLQALGGHMEIESMPARGTCVRMVVPYQ